MKRVSIIFIFMATVAASAPAGMRPKGPCENSAIKRAKMYAHTTRGIEHLDETLPAAWLDVESFRGKRLLDAGAGAGQLVEELRGYGIEAYGIDLVFDKNHLYREHVPLLNPMRDASYLIRADMLALPFRAEAFDLIYSTYSLFSPAYEGKDIDTVKAALAELKRVVKVNGLIRLSPADSATIKRAIGKIGGLEITNQTEMRRAPTLNVVAVEIRRTH